MIQKFDVIEKKAINAKEPKIVSEDVGVVFARGTCGNAPCKGKYQ